MEIFDRRKYRGDGTVGSPVTIRKKPYSGKLNNSRGMYHILNGLRHREDGPAIEYSDGSKQWWKDGVQHRLDGPADEWADGSKLWIVDGRIHRIDGPAVELANGITYWVVNGVSINVIEIFGYEPTVPLTEDQQMILRLTA